MHIRAIVQKEVLWPGQDEDMEDINGEPEGLDEDGDDDDDNHA
jgi:hypothetical protein